MEFILEFDDKVIHFVDENLRCEFMDKIMRFVSSLGNNGAIWIGIAFALIILGGEKRKAGWLMIFSLAVEASICNVIIKPTVARVRPNDKHNLDITIKRPTDYSFPSGHTAASFAAAYSMCLSGFKKGLPMIYLSILMGFSRIYLLVHYPMDVIVGAILGIVSASSVHKLSRKRRKKKIFKLI